MDISTIRPIAEAADSVCCIVRPGDRLEAFTGTMGYTHLEETV